MGRERAWGEGLLLLELWKTDNIFKASLSRDFFFLWEAFLDQLSSQWSLGLPLQLSPTGLALFESFLLCIFFSGS